MYIISINFLEIKLKIISIKSIAYVLIRFNEYVISFNILQQKYIGVNSAFVQVQCDKIGLWMGKNVIVLVLNFIDFLISLTF